MVDKPQPSTSDDAPSATREGLALTLGAFLLWGFNPFYFKAVAEIPPYEVLMHRVLWSVVLLTPFYFAMRRPWPFRMLRRDPRLVKMLIASTTIIACNWLIYIYAIGSDQVLQASLGYYITPLFNVAMGILLLRERLSPVRSSPSSSRPPAWCCRRSASVPCRGSGSGIALTFSTYGLLRKQMGIGSIDGLFVEVMLMLPVALGFLIWWEIAGTGAFLHRSLSIDLLLMAAGPVTAVPLALFAAGARRISLVMLGFCQYLAPSIYFLLGLFWYGEPFGTWSFAAFALIWLALAIFTIDTMRGRSIRTAR